LLSSQECDNRIVHKNLGHGFDATSTIFAALGDFDLFLTVKEGFEHAGVTEEDQLSEEPCIILRSTPGGALERVFEPWREHIHNVNQSDGGYIDSETI
jgi:hypothetical protein